MDVVLIVLGVIVYAFIALTLAGFMYWQDDRTLISESWYIILGFLWPGVTVWWILYQFCKIPWSVGEKLSDMYDDRRSEKEEKESEK